MTLSSYGLFHLFSARRASRQETARSAVKAGGIMATEKKFRIHYPLALISAPVLTHLVTDFDLSPNVLRADVSTSDGGWLVLGLTGDDARLQSALDWLRGQGLEVSEEA